MWGIVVGELTSVLDSPLGFCAERRDRVGVDRGEFDAETVAVPDRVVVERLVADGPDQFSESANSASTQTTNSAEPVTASATATRSFQARTVIDIYGLRINNVTDRTSTSPSSRRS